VTRPGPLRESWLRALGETFDEMLPQNLHVRGQAFIGFGRELESARSYRALERRRLTGDWSAAGGLEPTCPRVIRRENTYTTGSFELEEINGCARDYSAV
jgi:hypothetical protein